MTAQELIEHLQQAKPDSEVVVFDHFGQPIYLDTGDFQITQGLAQEFVVVRAVDIGPEPE